MWLEFYFILVKSVTKSVPVSVPLVLNNEGKKEKPIEKQGKN